MIQTAVAFHRQGNLSKAETAYRSVLAQQPDHFEALHYLGLLKLQQGHAGEAVSLISKAVDRRPQALDALCNLAAALMTLQRHADALGICDRVLAVRPRDPEALFNRGVALMRLGRPDEALASFDRALAERPEHINAWFNRGSVLAAQERYADALASYDKVLALNPSVLPALHNRGNVLVKLGRCEEALTAFAGVLTRAPGNLDALNGRAIALRQLGRHDEALACCAQMIAAHPNHAPALISRGNVQLMLKRFAEALADFDKVLSMVPDHVEALLNRGAVLTMLDRPDEALQSYGRAATLASDNADVLNKCAAALYEFRRYGEALACCDRIVALRPESAQAHHGQASMLIQLRHYDEAVAALDRALAIRPDDRDALNARAYALARLRHFDQACASYERLLAIDPNYPEVVGELAHCYLCMCDWDNEARVAPELTRRAADGTSTFPPFVLLGLPVEPADLLACTRRFVTATLPRPAAPAIARRNRTGALRVAYLSANFHQHAVGYLIAGLFEQHDRSRVEPIGISFGPDDQSELRRRLVRTFDAFHDVSPLGDGAAAALLRELDVDIAVDLMGHTESARPGILAYRPAPVQVAYLGYPGPMGTDFIDYVIADATVLPADQQAFYDERIVRLPDSYQVNDAKRSVAARVPSRSDMGLPEHGFVFCCFNQIWKIARPTFAAWMRLLRAIDGSVLWLFESNALAKANLRKEARVHGIAPERLVFAPYCEQAAHLARHKLADLVLDTLPYNAHTTASDALWAGVPLVTCMGTTFAGRVAASLLRAVGLPELVTTNLADYEALALRLASDPALLNATRSKLERNRLTHPLFDTARFARHIEAAYATMWDTWQRGEPPASFNV